MSRSVFSLVAQPRLGRSLELSAVLAVMALGACNSVLGIEDLHEGPAPGSGATGAGGNDASGGSDTSPNGGSDTSPTAGKGGTPAEGGMPSEGGSSPTPEGGETSAAGAPNPDDPTVRGKVIDVWGQVLPGVTVQIGDQRVKTNGLGEFTIEEVPAKYDVGLVVRPEGEDYGWYFVGLTRRNPTLQVYRGLDSREAGLEIRPKNVAPTADQHITVAIGTPGGNWSAGVGANGLDPYAWWRGAKTTTGTAHGLFWTWDDDELPISYQAYKAQTVALEEGGDKTKLDIDLTPGTLPSGPVQGTITADESHENDVFVRFTSHASIRIAREYSGPSTFSYLVPTLANASVTVMANEGYVGEGFGLAHADGLAAGATNVKLTIPKPPEPLLPAPGATNVTVGTKLEYDPSPDHTGGVVIYIENDDFNQAMFIVTTEREIPLPQIADGIFTLDKAQTFSWYVETHGQFDSVDDMTGPDGFIDSFASSTTEPLGMDTSSGSYTLSFWNRFTTAP